MNTLLDDRLKDELASFQTLWRGGYFEGDPLNPLAPSAYSQLNYISILHATYLRCIKPYVNDRTTALEIGPGRGAWTRCMLSAKEIAALDALPASHNQFFEYLGHPKHVKYFQVSDFLCAMLPDDHFTFMFSHGCLCHVSFDGIEQYARNLFPKLKSGADCFWMIADYEKLNRAHAHMSIWDSLARIVPAAGRPLVAQLKQMSERVDHASIEEDTHPSPGRWFNAGTQRTCAMLESAGYQIVDPDVGTNIRDPIIYFRKP
jgi:hypothetical protein